MRKQLPNDQIARMIERQNVITFKRKLDGKGSAKSQKEQDDDISSAKSNPLDDPSFNKPSKKSIPLPELSKQKKRLILKNILPETKSQSNTNYLDKEVRQQDNLMLKNLNNSLTNENIKLKTKNMNLEKEITKLQKMLEEDPQKQKLISVKDIKLRPSESNSLKIALKNMQKQLEEVKKENSKIKTSIKFTTINELEVERDNILDETLRLREMLQEQRNKLMYLKANQSGISAMEQRLTYLQDKNHYLSRENHELKGKMSKTDEKDRSQSKMSENQKNLNKMLFNARRLLKEKDKEIDNLKNQLKKESNKDKSKFIEVTSNENSRNREVKSELNNTKSDRPDKLKNIKEKRLMSKSAQKYRTAVTQQKLGECQNCKMLKDETFVLKKQIEQLKADLQQAKIQKSPVGQLSKSPIVIPTPEDIEKLSRFLVHRFKAHHLTLEQASYHLISFEGKPEDLQKDISVAQLLEIAMAEPFSILSDRYIQTFILYICYNEVIVSPPADMKCLIEDKKKLKRKDVQALFKFLVGNFQLINQSRQEEMFIQIAELVTQYQQHILKALTEKRNSENTIAQNEFYDFFKEIELEKEYIDFMVCQIILESLDLDHLNIYNLFEIFYMPPQEQIPTTIDPMKMYGTQQPQKKKYQMIESVVKEEDEEYEESKSFMESRQKTLSKHEEEGQPKKEQIKQERDEQQGISNKDINNESKMRQDYEQDHFEEEKMENPVEEEEKPNEEHEKQIDPQHYEVEQLEEEYVDDYQN